MNLSSINITCIKSLSLRGKKDIALQVLDSEKIMQLLFSDLVYLNISNDIFDMGDDEVSVIEVNHEYRTLKKDDLKRYSFEWDERLAKNPFHIVHIHGNTVLEIVCRNLGLET